MQYRYIKKDINLPTKLSTVDKSFEKVQQYNSFAKGFKHILSKKIDLFENRN